MKFQLVSDYKPKGDQPQAIEKLIEGINTGRKHQVLLGVTGCGKTYTIANIIEKTKLPTLVISHNKTLAAQLYQEFREFFPKNAVSYFVSYYDYYQPEAYLPQTDTYIAKETEINKLIDKLRMEATTNLMTREEVIVVASVSCIYNIGNPKDWGSFVLELKVGEEKSRREILKRLVELQYERGDDDFQRGTFRARGDTLEVWPAGSDEAVKLQLLGEKIEKIVRVNPLTGRSIPYNSEQNRETIYPAKYFITSPRRYPDIFVAIREELSQRLKVLKKEGRYLEGERLKRRVEYDLEMIKEVGYVNGIENYSRYFDGRKPGEPPFTLLDYFHYSFGENFLVIIDESHMTIPQIRGMYRGDLERKKNLIEYGFRLPSCLDNRPLRFGEFLPRVPQLIYTSATPDDWEIKKSSQVVEQLIRPTGLLEPKTSVRPTEGQVENLVKEIEKRTKRGERVLVTTLTKRMAEALSDHLLQKKIQVHYLHSDIETLRRSDILDDLRAGFYDAVVGVNLLREGLDLPEVSLVAILDADKEGFLRSKTSLIQVMGRAARHEKGEVIMYADGITGSMREAIEEVNRRRKTQVEYNRKHKIKPKTIQKPIRKKIIEKEERVEKLKDWEKDLDQLTPQDRKELVKKLKRAMYQAARELEFEEAGELKRKIEILEVYE